MSAELSMHLYDRCRVYRAYLGEVPCTGQAHGLVVLFHLQTDEDECCAHEHAIAKCAQVSLQYFGLNTD